MVHGSSNCENAEKASCILYSKEFKNDIKSVDEATFLDIFEGVPQANIQKQKLRRD